jgi:hypothetical protein
MQKKTKKGKKNNEQHLHSIEPLNNSSNISAIRRSIN